MFGEDNCVAQITIEKTSSQTQDYLSPVTDYVLWFAKSKGSLKFRAAWLPKERGQSGFAEYSRLAFPDLTRRPMTIEEKSSPNAVPSAARVYRQDNLTSQSVGREKGEGAASWFPVVIQGTEYRPSITNRWKTSEIGMTRLGRAGRLEPRGTSLSYVRFIDDFSGVSINNIWGDVKFSSRAEDKTYVVQTSARTVQRCVLMATDPGDLVIDPTCGSGTTAFVAEQWGRRWITIDTSRVALALARARIMGARYPFFLLADSEQGQAKAAEVTHTAPSTKPVHGSIRHGFVYERVPHVTLKSIANNAEIDIVWDEWQARLNPMRSSLNEAMGESWEDWQVPRVAERPWSDKNRGIFVKLAAERSLKERANTAVVLDLLAALNASLKRQFTLETLPVRPADPWTDTATRLHAAWWEAKVACQRAIDASIAAHAEFEYLYDRPYEDKRKVRVAGPFTVESISPHRTLGVDEHDELIDPLAKNDGPDDGRQSFPDLILENLKAAGVQQAHKADRIEFTAIAPWPGRLVCADGRYFEGATERRGAIFIGPEFGTVTRVDLVDAAKEAAEAGFDSLIACAFNFEAHTTDFNKLGRVPVMKARMNAELHMADDLKATGKGNLFVIFGEPDIVIEPAPDKADPRVTVTVKGVDVFHPNSGEVRSDAVDGIACWFIDTDYNEESFFVRHAYFLGANDPYNALRTTLKAEINADAWASLHSATSRPFERPQSGRIAVKVINHLGDEVMKVFRVPSSNEGGR